MEGGKEANYWPGFVDALSNVVVTMVFVMVVLVIGLLYYSQNKAKEMIAAAKHDAEERLSKEAKPDPDLAKKLAELMKENEALKKDLAAAKAAGAGVAAGGVQAQTGSVAKAEIKAGEADGKAGTNPGPGQIRGNQGAIEVTYPNRTHELDKATLATLESQFAAIAERAKTTGVELAAVSENLPYSEGRRLSYYRNLTIRNWLIDRGVPAGKIRARIAEGTTGKDTGQVLLSIPGDK